jgi:hypothetical protein
MNDLNVLTEAELDAVSGGDVREAMAANAAQAKQDALDNARQQAEDKKAGDQIKSFQAMLIE